MQQAVDFCMKREEDKKIPQQIMSNIRLKSVRAAVEVLRDIVQGQVSVDLTKRRDQCMHATEVFVDDLY